MSALTPPVLAALRQCRWVHTQGMASTCEGCANDGEPGYCRGAGIGPEQDDLGELWCHCGHAVTLVELPIECDCVGPTGWHCPGEDSQHWAEWQDDPRSPCGHCGGDPLYEEDDTMSDPTYPAPQPLPLVDDLPGVDPLRAPGTDDEQAAVDRARYHERGVFVVLIAALILVGAVVVMLAAIWFSSTPRSGPDPTAAPSPGDVSPAGAGASGRTPSGAPTVSTGGRLITAASRSIELGAPLPAQGAVSSVAYGKASWCAPTPKYCHGWGGRSLLAASPNWAGHPYWATVCRTDGVDRCVTVHVVSVCACGTGKVIDLTVYAFRDRLGGRLRDGTLDVVVTRVRSTLPPTDTVQ